MSQQGSSSPVTDRNAPSGAQFLIGHGKQEVVVTEVGATLRSFTVNDVNVIDGFPITDICSGGRGQILVPWPNRLEDGKYDFEGVQGKAPLDEPQYKNAIHGLMRWLPWEVQSQAQNVITMRCVLQPQPAYPWRLQLLIEYRLGRGGLTVTTEARNLSPTPSPFGLGFHPYLRVGSGGIDDLMLQVPARRYLESDNRKLPVADADVKGTRFDFTEQRLVGSSELDTGFTSLVRGSDQIARVEIDDPHSQSGVTLWLDSGFRYLMVFTGDTLNPADARRRSIAVEPMTCAPNALRTQTNVIKLDPDASWKASWGISPRL